ncbi:hypothetical protein QA601_12090 [Chitinispirillales bacterium ANBcel5]|uniref:hypothetical protein n=1 Tax=Cellulosispirillum alkaliphilum TaxID=3039283 RepID=UPI002A514EC0|nr:hypothetical protein [Chitinispirillales bacterium ANBcel5]
MFVRNFLLIALSASALVLAGGRPAPEEENGVQPWEEENGVMDTTEVEGTVIYVDEDEEMFVLDQIVGEDTIFWDDQTMFAPDHDEEMITEGAELRVEYYTDEMDRNIATFIEPTDNDVFGGNGEHNGERPEEENGEKEYDEENGRRPREDNDYDYEEEENGENNNWQ